MTLAATLSVSSAILDFFFAVLMFRLSSGPGFRELRWFACACLSASVFSIANVWVTLDIPAVWVVRLGQLNILAAGLHGVFWIPYVATKERRRMTRFERGLLTVGLVIAFAWLVPGLLLSERVEERRLEWIGWTYRDIHPTPLGEACFLFYCATLVYLVAHFVRQRKTQGAVAHIVGLGAFAVAGFNDAAATDRLLKTPLVLDLGLVVLLVAVGGSLTSRFVESARLQVEASRRLQAAQVELVERERLAALGSLSAVIAHEVRNSLSVIFNALATLRKRPADSDDARTLFTIVEEEATRLKRMVADLLDFARPYDLHLAPTKIRDLLGSAVATSRLALDDEKAAITLEAPRDLEEIVCDQHLVRQAVVNLVANALQAAGKRTPVVVRAERPQGCDEIVVSVVDDGEGIAKEHRERIFEPFFTTRPTGTGLGLALVRRVAEAHGGSVKFEPTEGGGATFHLTLPLLPSVVMREAARV